MKFYDIDSIFTFGKYEGMTIAEVYEKDPKYIKYCQDNIDEFYVSNSVMKELKAMSREMTDAALLNANLDEMTDDEIAAMMSSLDDDDDFSDISLQDDFDWENEDIADDSMFEDVFDEFEDDYDEDDFSNGGFEDLY